MKKQFYTTKEAAEILNMTERYIRHLVRIGKIYAIKPFGNRWMIPVEVIEDMRKIKNNSEDEISK